MNRSLVKRVLPRGTAWAAVFALGSAMLFAQDAPAAGSRSDGQIEMDVVHALDGSRALKDDLITAATIQSEVTLSGTVSTDSSRRLAESIAKGVPGVTQVHNNLKIGNPADDPNAQGAVLNDQGGQDVADNQQQNAPPQNAGAPPDYAQNAPQNAPQNQQQGYPQDQPPAYGQNQQQGYPQDQPPAYGQNQPQGYPQDQRPAYGQNPPPPGYGQAPPPGYGQNQSQYPPQYQERPPYGEQQAPPPPRYEMPRGPVTVPQGTLIQVRTNEPVNSKRARGGEPIQFTVIQDVVFGGVLAIPRGATVHGVVAEAKHPDEGALTGSSELGLQLTSLDLGGMSYPLQSDLFRVKGPGKGEHTAGNVVGGAILGAIIGGAVGRGEGAAIGAAAGGGAGLAASSVSSGPGVWIPAEAQVAFHLTTPITVQPVSQQEAMRLAQGLYPGGPSLYRRAPGAYPYRPYPYGYYAPVYYRPYYYSGGFYYWR
jgi:hypothetical protein